VRIGSPFSRVRSFANANHFWAKMCRYRMRRATEHGTTTCLTFSTHGQYSDGRGSSFFDILEEAKSSRIPIFKALTGVGETPTSR
jgi:hypothetical protein